MINKETSIKLNDGVIFSDDAKIYKKNGLLFNKGEIPESLLNSTTYLTCAIVTKIKGNSCYLAYHKVKGIMIVDKKYLHVIKRMYNETEL